MKLFLSDILYFLTMFVLLVFLAHSWVGAGRAAWKRVFNQPAAMAALPVFLVCLLIATLDCLHFSTARGTRSALDLLAGPLATQIEKTYSAPLATHLFDRETIVKDDGSMERVHQPLKFGGVHLTSPQHRHSDIIGRVVLGILLAVVVWALLSVLIVKFLQQRGAYKKISYQPMLASALVICLLIGVAVALAGQYHVLGTDKVGHDVLYQSLKSLRTGIMLGTLTSLSMVPLAVVLGLAAGYFGRWVDDLVQYLYTVVNSIPGVLLIAATVLMMQVALDSHDDWFGTTEVRADVKLVALCLILGLTGWMGLCRLLRGEALKLRQMDYVQAARAFALPNWKILYSHLLPNVMHIILICVVMDFSGLVLAEAVLSYVGIGVDPSTISFGGMINNARFELARSPVVWWSLASALSFMLALVLSINVVADAINEALNPQLTGRQA